MPGPRAVQNLQMPNPRDWQGVQMPCSSPGGPGRRWNWLMHNRGGEIARKVCCFSLMKTTLCLLNRGGNTLCLIWDINFTSNRIIWEICSVPVRLLHGKKKTEKQKKWSPNCIYPTRLAQATEWKIRLLSTLVDRNKKNKNKEKTFNLLKYDILIVKETKGCSPLTHLWQTRKQQINWPHILKQLYLHCYLP